jgi:hypothetical protein
MRSFKNEMASLCRHDVSFEDKRAYIAAEKCIMSAEANPKKSPT